MALGANADMLDDYPLLNLGARYAAKVGNSSLTPRANVANVTNGKYRQGSRDFMLTQGAPRACKVSAQLDF